MVRISVAMEILEEVGFVGGLIGVQIVFSIYQVFVSHLMSIGFGRFFLIIYGNLVTALFLLPLSILFERHKWPKKFSIKLFMQLVIFALGGVTLFQSLMLTGVKKTSPAIASALPNLAPGFIFIIASALRFEKVNPKCIYSQVKIVGTLICIIGAVTMSFLHGTHTVATSSSHETNVEEEKLLGFICLMAAVFVLSCSIVLQAATLGDFPAPMSFCAVTSFLGSILTAVAQLIQEHKLDTNWPLVSTRDLLGCTIVSGIICAACTSFQGWAMKKRGPVLVSIFSPVGTVCSTILSVVTLGDSITIGSVAGMFLMFSGLYFVLWAKKNETASLNDDETRKGFDPEKPLLS